MPELHYEDFCAAPLAGLEQICDALVLPIDASALERFGSRYLSGDSGRRAINEISLRPRRPIPVRVRAELSDPSTYQALCTLCDRMGYSAASASLQ
jgi:hypothetical protein